MKRFFILGAAAFVLSTGMDARRAYAQYNPLPPIYNQPAISPYLGLTNRGATPGQNYYSIVAPNLYQNQRINQLQQQTTANQQAIQQTPDMLLATGHPTTFLNYRRYFQNTAATAAGTTMGSVSATGPFAPTRQGFGTGQGVGFGGAGFNMGRTATGGPGSFAPNIGTGLGRPNLPY